MGRNVLIIGNGGREHAIAWKITQSPRLGNLYAAPGNGGTHEIAENVPIEPTNIFALVQFAKEEKIDLTVVGPEDPLALGVVDAFRERGLNIFGPTRAAAEIETSKAFAKELMQDAEIPTASFQIFSDYHKARAYLRKHGAPIVVKASGLAGGKGAYPCRSIEQAEEALAKILVHHIHGSIQNTVVIEEFLEGEEISIHAFSDGKHAPLVLPPVQDHKRAGDDNTGENTGGMGAIAPVPWVDDAMLEHVDTHIVQPLVRALAKRGRAFTGCLFPGIITTSDGPKVLEVNARLGDPETQCYMRLLKTDLLDIFEASILGTLANLKVEWHPGFAACVVLASGGYPGAYRKNFLIDGVSDAESIAGLEVFHAGTKWVNYELRTCGGRVLGVTAMGETLGKAITQAYEAVQCVTFPGMQYRHDIGAQALIIRPRS